MQGGKRRHWRSGMSWGQANTHVGLAELIMYLMSHQLRAGVPQGQGGGRSGAGRR